jgi:3-hydroxyisobutyrate dehydrogenase
MNRIAVLGLGAMGSRVAQNLLQSGYHVVVYNRTADKATSLVQQGALYAATPKEAAAQADVVISMVTDDEGSRSIWLDPEIGAAAGLRNDSIAIESSTLSLVWTKELAAAIESQGVAFLDAPVVGSRPQAEAGTLIYLVGGRAETLAQVHDVLLSVSSTVHHVGAIGQGMAMKLVVNALFGIQVVALAEIMGLLTKSGITSTEAMACLGELPVLSPAAKGAGNLMLANHHAPLFPIDLVAKDLRYVLQSAQAMQATMPTAAAVQEIYQQAIAQGYGSNNITGVAQLFT